jgi:hemoglobin/transferrin/lactoferrin receptor protein
VQLDEMTISGKKWEEHVHEVAGKIEVLTSDVVQLQNPQTSADLLGASDKVFIQKSQLGGGSPMIRGFATNRVLLVIDGVRMNNAIFRSGNVQNVISLDANSIRKTEIIFGPGTAIYGSDAIGGVMDFHTIRPELTTNGKARASGNAMYRFSSANRERTTHADVNIGLKKWAFFSSFTRSFYDDLRMGSDGPVDYQRPDFVKRLNGTDERIRNPDADEQIGSAYDQLNLLQKLYFRPSKEWAFEYAFHYSTTSSYDRYDRLILRNEEGLANAEWYYGPQKWQMHALNVSNNSKTIFSDHMHAVIAFQHYEESRHNRSFRSVNKTNRFEEVDAFSVNVDADKQLSEKTSLFYGAEFITNAVGSSAYRLNIADGTRSQVSTRYPDGSRWRNYAVYGSVKHSLNQKWMTTLSIRFTHVTTEAEFNKTTFEFPFKDGELVNSSLNGSLGLIYNPTADTHLYVNIGTGFRAPNVDDIGKVFDSQPGAVVVPNPSLRSETAYNAELGFYSQIGRVRVDGAIFHTWVEDAIARGGFLFEGQDSIIYDGEKSKVLAQQNISSVKVYGAQFGMQVEMAEGFSLRSTINYQKGKEQDPESGKKFSPTHVAPLFGATHLVFSNKKLKIDLNAVYNGKISYPDLALSERADAHLYANDNNGKPYAPEWLTLNMKFHWDISSRFSLGGGVENILDKRYRPYSSGISAPGRNFILALRAQF